MDSQSKSAAKTTPAIMALKIFLHVFNLIYLLIGGAILGIGIWTKTELHMYMELTGLYYDNSAYVMIGVGTLILLVSMGGFYCTAKSKVALLYLYAIFVGFITVLELAAGIAGGIFWSKIDQQFKTGLEDNVSKYSEKKEAWDKVQQLFSCCGANGPSDWGNTSIPESCYKSGSSLTTPTTATTATTTTTASSEATTNISISTTTTASATATSATSVGPRTPFPEGCHQKLSDDMRKYLYAIVASAFGFIVVQFVGVVLSCCLARKTNKNNYEQIY